MPGFTLSFFMYQALLEGETLTAAFERTTTGFWPTVRICAPFYMCAHVVTFGVVPPHYRIAWASSAAVLWTAFLSYSNQELKDAEYRSARR